MDDVLLIHHDNTPLIEDCPNQIKYSPSDDDLKSSDLDTFISKQIIPKIKERSFRTLLIKDTLSDNYIDFHGLILAFHVRLSLDELNERSRYPIIILSDTTELVVNRLSLYGRLLFTKNVFLSKNNVQSVNRILDYDLKPLKEEEYNNNFLSLINIYPPQDYLSHHSITNEWAIDQWAYMLDLDSDAIRNNRRRISSLLYYKYLIAKFHLKTKQSIKIKSKKVSGRVLLIDDKCGAGWGDVLQKFMSSCFSNVEFDRFLEITSWNSIEELKLRVIQKIQSENTPDLVLLDLRLLDMENSYLMSHNNGNSIQRINKISGLVILNAIKELNPGIQVIIFTASSDSKILDELRSRGILGYVKKDAPEERYQAPKSSFRKLTSLIEIGLEKKYLKKIFRTEQEMVGLENIKKSPDLVSNLKLVFNILNSDIPQPYLYAMYTIFKCLEMVNDRFIRDIEKGKRAIWVDNDQLIDGLNVSFENKLKLILQRKLSIADREIENEIKKLVCCRNYSIHPGKIKSHCMENFISEPSSQDIVTWFSMLNVILSKLDQSYMSSIE